MEVVDVGIRRFALNPTDDKTGTSWSDSHWTTQVLQQVPCNRPAQLVANSGLPFYFRVS
jgi:hypothetical protein